MINTYSFDMKPKSKVNFYLEKRKDKETGETIVENVPIFLFFSFDGKRLQYYTGHRIDLAKWNEDKQEVIRNNFNKAGKSSTDINDDLNKIKTEVTTIYKTFKANKKTPTVEQIRNELKKIFDVKKEDKKGSFFEVFDQFIKDEGQAKTWTKGTITKFETNIEHLKTFQTFKKFTIDFDCIDDTFFSNYVAYQMDELKHRNTTISKNLRIFKWFMNWATKKGFNTNLKYREYAPKLKGTTRSQKIIFLTWEELMYLYTFNVTKNYLNQVRDVFCFCCFSGLRYSDVYNLKRSNIKKDTIELTTIKTDDDLSIDLNDYSRAILDKYKDIPFEDDKCLPVISNQKMNEYLKELGQLVELNEPETVIYYQGAERKEKTYKKWQLLSTHVGRKTFVSNALFFNIPAEVVMSWTGHKDHKVMENYYKILGKQKRREMDKFNEQQ